MKFNIKQIIGQVPKSTGIFQNYLPTTHSKEALKRVWILHEFFLEEKNKSESPLGKSDLRLILFSGFLNILFIYVITTCSASLSRFFLIENKTR